MNEPPKTPAELADEHAATQPPLDLDERRRWLIRFVTQFAGVVAKATSAVEPNMPFDPRDGVALIMLSPAWVDALRHQYPTQRGGIDALISEVMREVATELAR